MADAFDAAHELAQAQAELDLRAARIAGLERLIGQAEQLGRVSAVSLAKLMRTLGVPVEAHDALPSRVPALVTTLSDHLIQARNQYGLRVAEMRGLAAQAEALEKERNDLLARVDAAERELESRPPATRGPRPGASRGRLRILMALHDFLPRHRGGTEIYSWRIAKALGMRHDVHLFFTEARPDVPSYQVLEGTYDGLPFTEVSHQHVADSFERSWRDPMMESRFAAVLDRVRPDVVHVQHLEHLSLGILGIVKAAGIPIVYTLHDYALLCPRGGRMIRADFERCARPVPERCAECIGATPLRPRIAGEENLLSWMLPEGLWRLVSSAMPGTMTSALPPETAEDRRLAVTARLDAVRDALAEVDLLVAPSAWLRQTFLDCGMADPGRIVVSENGQDPAPFRGEARREGDRFRVGYLGAIVPEKGVHVLVDALNRLADLDDVEGVIHGFSDANPAYARTLEAANTNPRVRFAGAFAPEEAAGILAQLDALVVPSLWWENSPLTIQEAFLAGVPVLVSDIGGMAEKVADGKNGIHFPVGDAGALATRLRELHADRTRLLRLSAARPLVKTIAEDAQDLEARYRQLLESAASR